MSAVPIDLFFDPGCPYTWRRSRWLVGLADSGTAGVTWRLMSLGILNEDKEVPEQYREPMRQAQAVLRVLAAVGETEGNAAIGRVYSALGARRHDQGEPFTEELVAVALAEAGVPSRLASAADESWDAAVRETTPKARRRWAPSQAARSSGWGS